MSKGGGSVAGSKSEQKDVPKLDSSLHKQMIGKILIKGTGQEVAIWKGNMDAAIRAGLLEEGSRHYSDYLGVDALEDVFALLRITRGLDELKSKFPDYQRFIHELTLKCPVALGMPTADLVPLFQGELAMPSVSGSRRIVVNDIQTFVSNVGKVIRERPAIFGNMGTFQVATIITGIRPIHAQEDLTSMNFQTVDELMSFARGLSHPEEFSAFMQKSFKPDSHGGAKQQGGGDHERERKPYHPFPHRGLVDSNGERQANHVGFQTPACKHCGMSHDGECKELCRKWECRIANENRGNHGGHPMPKCPLLANGAYRSPQFQPQEHFQANMSSTHHGAKYGVHRIAPPGYVVGFPDHAPRSAYHVGQVTTHQDDHQLHQQQMQMQHQQQMQMQHQQQMQRAQEMQQQAAADAYQQHHADKQTRAEQGGDSVSDTGSVRNAY